MKAYLQELAYDVGSWVLFALVAIGILLTALWDVLVIGRDSSEDVR